VRFVIDVAIENHVRLGSGSKSAPLGGDGRLRFRLRR
jgi:hypothetical protein